jgi:predicted peptidase
VAQQALEFTKKISVEVSMDYLLHLPENYNESNEKFPLVLFLHGAGECGNDIEIVKRNGIPKLVDEGKKFPFIAISPQCPENSWWGEELEVLSFLLDNIIESYRVDEDRVYLTGLSMGGYGTWLFAELHPERFAAIAPICGGGEPQFAHNLKDTPIWAFHGNKDDIVPIEESEIMVKAVEEAGGKVKFTVYEGVGHNSWVRAYEDPELYEWLLMHKHKKK